MERYYKSVVDVGKKLLGLVALALDLEENFFERLGAFNDQAAVVRLLRYSGELNSSKEEEPCGASAHSDFGMLTLLATDGVPGLQVLAFISHNLLIKKYEFLHCSNKWLHTKKALKTYEDFCVNNQCFVVNIGDLMERWTNGLFRDVGKKLLGLVALALDLEENFFERLGAFNDQAAVVRLLRYSGELNSSKEEEPCGASAHSDFGMLTLLATDGVPGLQVCRDKDKEPNVWEDCFVVNIGDLMERWTNGLFRSTMHRVLSVGEERYSVAVFLDPDPNCVVECLESCCSQTYPPRYYLNFDCWG
ncbi:hypothetical protein Bca52824_087883 [Brassica carinata]|uniref:Fe2OG dioxygenase domain-containing protein n=1 Tax=Brassica carinata TaxID=52824 RepID=A0A8X7PBL6_BRACI|nr:hypothetical protein Bca52824_087883 [Brassica carinata]